MTNWEKIHTVTNWYDGARLGIADYGGKPHLYESRWDNSKGCWEGEDDAVCHYWLSPVSSEIFAWAMEDWAIWNRWQIAVEQGKVDPSTHPATPEDRPRHEQLQELLGASLEPGRPGSFLVIGEFDQGGVRWTNPAARES